MPAPFLVGYGSHVDVAEITQHAADIAHQELHKHRAVFALQTDFAIMYDTDLLVLICHAGGTRFRAESRTRN